MRRLRWDAEEPKGSKHQLRDTALVYAFLAVLVVVITAASGGSVVKGIVAGVVVFVAATAYSWLRWRQKEKARKREERET